MAKSNDSKFVSVGGVRIRKGKSAAQIAEQYNRITDELKNRAIETQGRTLTQDEYENFDNRSRRLTRIGQALLDSGRMSLDDSDGFVPGVDYRLSNGRILRSPRYANSHLMANSPNAVYGAKANNKG